MIWTGIYVSAESMKKCKDDNVAKGEVRYSIFT